MPLRDHFCPPLSEYHRWNELHAGWPMMLVRDLFDILPPSYVSAPNALAPEQDEYEVRIYNAESGRKLVATVEFVSPANKDRPESRRAFVAKVVALLKQGVCVSVVDLVTVFHFTLYAELLDFIGEADPKLGPTPHDLYAFTIRSLRRTPQQTSRLELWYYPMALGETLPTLPLWLSDEIAIPVSLEPSYEETCRLLHIT